MVHDDHAHHDDHHHHHGDGGAQVGIIGPAQKLQLDEVAQHHLVAAPQKVGDGKRGHGRHKHHGHPGQDARQGQGEDHLAEYPHPVRPQVPGGLDEGVVQLDDDGIDRQDHEGQVVIHHAQHHRPGGADHGDVLHPQQVQQSDGPEQLV